MLRELVAGMVAAVGLVGLVLFSGHAMVAVRTVGGVDPLSGSARSSRRPRRHMT